MQQKFEKFLFTAAISVAFVLPFLPIVVRADNTITPELNPICWQEQDCNNWRKKFGVAENTPSGWMENVEPCTKSGWGKCLPAGATITEVSFGGQKKFENMGTFILQIYNYAVQIAGVLAVVIIIIAGVQWMTAGGNAEAINGAKKRITGSVVGLLIAYLSYFILNSINPALVNMRLPQAFMMRPMVLGSEFCNDMPSSTQFAFAAGKGAPVDKNSISKKTEADWTVISKRSTDMLACGNQWFIKNSGGLTCVSSICDTSAYPQVCAKKPQTTNTYDCTEGSIIVSISANYLIQPDCVPGTGSGFTWNQYLPGVPNGWARAYPDRGIVFFACNNKTYMVPDIEIDLKPNDETRKIETMVIKIPKVSVDSLASGNYCKADGGNKGVFINLGFNRSCKANYPYELHSIGKSGVDLGVNAGAPFDAGSLIPAENLAKGVSLNIDVASVQRQE